ncbi:MAG: hypothetical protein LBG81_03545 [Coriobacteriaceae bacterium]|nr:hypothetical protein [Coriobacteriaceae bacterium]
MRSNLWIAQEFMAMSRGSSKAGFIVDDLCLVDKGIRRGISQDIDELDSQERRLGRLMDEEADAFRLACLKARGQEGAGKP